MTNILDQKQNLRQNFKSRRAALSTKDVVTRSQQINRNFIDNLLPKIYQKNSNQTFSLYLPSYGEVLTDLIAQNFQKNNIRFSYPKITQKNHHLDFILTHTDQRLQPSKFFPKILEPSDGINVFPDFVILPLLAFDTDLSRLGLGGGFFDRTLKFLKNQNSKIIAIGLAYDFQRSEELLPIENTDQKLDFIVTEKTIFSAS